MLGKGETGTPLDPDVFSALRAFELCRKGYSVQKAKDVPEKEFKRQELKNMKKTAVFAMIFLLLAGIAYAKGNEVKKNVGQYDVEVKIDNDPPVVGDNNISIEIKNKSGKYVTDATVGVEYSMPAMPGMPAMHYKEKAVVSGNTYKAVMNLSMAGSWNIEVKIKKDTKTRTVKFNVDAH